jgi:hypothetical protein
LLLNPSNISAQELDVETKPNPIETERKTQTIDEKQVMIAYNAVLVSTISNQYNAIKKTFGKELTDATFGVFSSMPFLPIDKIIQIANTYKNAMKDSGYSIQQIENTFGIAFGAIMNGTGKFINTTINSKNEYTFKEVQQNIVKKIDFEMYSSSLNFAAKIIRDKIKTITGKSDDETYLDLEILFSAANYDSLDNIYKLYLTKKSASEVFIDTLKKTKPELGENFKKSYDDLRPIVKSEYTALQLSEINSRSGYKTTKEISEMVSRLKDSFDEKIIPAIIQYSLTPDHYIEIEKNRFLSGTLEDAEVRAKMLIKNFDIDTATTLMKYSGLIFPIKDEKNIK